MVQFDSLDRCLPSRTTRWIVLVQTLSSSTTASLWAAWFSDWNYSIVSASTSGSKLKFSQIGVPPHRYSGHYRGWIEAYWTPMKEVIADGEISDKTRARVKASTQSRINRGHFRRKISAVA